METSGGLGTAESPRSTVIPALASSDLITNVRRMTQSGGKAEDGAADLKSTQPSSGDSEPNGNGKNTSGVGDAEDSKASPEANQGANNDKKGEGGLSPTPQPHYLHGYPAHLTPQTGQGYYPLGYQQSQVTPEPPSPAGPGATIYDVGSFFQQPAAFAHNSPFVPHTPLSPRRTAAMAGIPPASPLFPRVSTAAGAAGLVPTGTGIEQRLMDGHRVGAPPSPSVPYLSPPLGPNSMYQSYAVNGIGSQVDSPEDISGWGDRYVDLMYS